MFLHVVVEVGEKFRCLIGIEMVHESSKIFKAGSQLSMVLEVGFAVGEE
tara:strand:+ start:3917 stop:4063 length:147 start_codon:yes stop_codon:yes gene_type:complete